MTPRVAVLIPCLNEARSIGTVVGAFARLLPEAVVYVYDNNSSDGSVAVAQAAGAVIGSEGAQGKGHTVRRMFREVEADVYVLVDGDDTYDAESVVGMTELLVRDRLDMVVGARVVHADQAWRTGHRAGNHFFSRVISVLFGRRLSDVLSGYRVFSREFVKSFAGASAGFEIEAEMTVQALRGGFAVREVDTPYRRRPEGSWSKLNTWTDGLRILWFIVYARMGWTTSPATSVRRKSRP